MITLLTIYLIGLIPSLLIICLLNAPTGIDFPVMIVLSLAWPILGAVVVVIAFFIICELMADDETQRL